MSTATPSLARIACARGASVGIVAALFFGLAGCSANSPAASGSAPVGQPSPVAPATTGSANPTAAPAASSTPTALPEAVATPVAKVKRPSGPAQPTASASTAALTKAVTYPDGVVVALSGLTAGKETATGPGAFPGREFVAFDVTITNGSAAPIDLNTVVVTAFYGADNQRAAAVYADVAAARDFSGVVAPGASSTAHYAVAIPTAGRANATVVVDFDAAHTSATFSGTVKTA